MIRGARRPDDPAYIVVKASFAQRRRVRQQFIDEACADRQRPAENCKKIILIAGHTMVIFSLSVSPAECGRRRPAVAAGDHI
jgi:hypothetical protein